MTTLIRLAAVIWLIGCCAELFIISPFSIYTLIYGGLCVFMGAAFLAILFDSTADKE